LPLSRSQIGSAVVEFILLGTPALLLFSGGVTMFLNSYVDTVVRSVAIDAARFAALADQDQLAAQDHLDSKLSVMLPTFRVKAKIERGTNAIALLEYSSLPSFFNVLAHTVKIQVVAPIEK
jgi:hypothetical protein